jgi:hypothetical protein
MAADYGVKKGDNAAVIADVLNEDVGVLSNVTFFMRLRSNPAFKKNIAGTVVDAPTGEVKVTLTGDETAVLGIYDCEWRFSDPAGPGDTWTLPAGTYKELEILEALS